VKPDFPGGPPDMFFCGNDGDAKITVATVCTDFGWIPNDIGGLDGARQLEELAMLWIRHGFLNRSWNMAFKLLRK
jgi:predicted dinucleotide-binding enzyme